MSLVTRCTQCGTLFKVVADQLKISDGWVRCGQCATVFDAEANLVPAQPAQNNLPNQAPALSDPAPAPITQPSNTAESAASGIDAFAQSSGFSDEDLESTEIAVQAVIAARNGASLLPSPQSTSADHRLADDFRAGVLREPGELKDESDSSITSWAASDHFDAEHAVLGRDSVSAEPTTLSSSMNPSPEDTPSSVATPSFIAQAQRAARWRSPWMRLGLSLVALGLMAALALQFALHEKDRIVATRPDMKPWLAQLCQQTGCKIQPFKRIESIAVDASSFNRLQKNSAQPETSAQNYKLAITLKNTGALPVALPHVELSLQDAQDQTLLSRILSPADLGAALQALGPAGSPTQDTAGSITLQVNTAQIGGQRIAGYRVLAFYP